jgi:hypothetical protein
VKLLDALRAVVDSLLRGYRLVARLGLAGLQLPQVLAERVQTRFLAGKL